MKELKIEVPQGYEIDKEKSTFEKIVFKKVEDLPMSFDEMKIPEYWGIYNTILSKHETKNYTGRSFGVPVYSTKEYAEAFWALSKLIWLRDAWNKGWKPNWEKLDEIKYAIIFSRDAIKARNDCLKQEILAFEKSEIRDKFLYQFKNLIETAKPLL